MNIYEHMLAGSIAESITVTTPGRVTLHTIRRRRTPPILVVVAWLPVIAALVLAAMTVITR